MVARRGISRKPSAVGGVVSCSATWRRKADMLAVQQRADRSVYAKPPSGKKSAWADDHEFSISNAVPAAARKARWCWTSAFSRWRTICCARKIWRGREPKFPLRLAVCQSLLAAPDRGSGPAGGAVFGVSLFFLVFRSDAAPCASRRRNDTSRNFASARKASSSKSRATTVIFCKISSPASVPCLGIEPAANIAKVAQEKGIETLVEFFGRRPAGKLAAAGRQADLILGNNVFAHAPDTNDFVGGLGARCSSRVAASSWNFPTQWISSRTRSSTPFITSTFFISASPR